MNIPRLKMMLASFLLLSLLGWGCDGDDSSGSDDPTLDASSQDTTSPDTSSADTSTPDASASADASADAADADESGDAAGDVATPDPDDILPDPGETIVVGEGSGSLNIKDHDGAQLSIMPGTYWNINFENIKDTAVYGFDQVTVEGGDINIRNVDGLTLRGLTIRDYGQAVINVFDSADNLTLRDIKIRDISNYVIKFNIGKKYDGSPESYSENIRLINIDADNIGSLFVSGGGIEEDGFYGLIKNFVMKDCTITNSPHLSNAVYLNLGSDYEISGNTVDNVNASDSYPDGNNNHNGIFHVKGYGKIFNNKVTNHQGNAVRAWLFSIDSPDAVVEIYNNIVYNSTRYGAFELQVTPGIEGLSTFVPAHAKLYNNTAGHLNTGEPKYFEGRLLDLYGTHGNLEIHHNLYFDMRDEHLMNNMSGSTTITRQEENHYFEDATDAVVDLVDFESKVAGVGAQ